MRCVVAGFGSPGFLYPLLDAARALSEDGADVCVVTERGASATVAAFGFERVPFPGGDRASFAVPNWGDPLAIELQRRHVLAAATDVSASLVVTNILAIGPLLAAERLGIPVLVIGQLCHLWPADTGAVADSPSTDVDELTWRYRDAGRLYAQARDALGYPVRRWDVHDFPMLGDRLLLRGAPALEPAAERLSERVGFAGPCWLEPPGRDQAAHAWLDAGPGEFTAYTLLGRTFGEDSVWPWLRRELASSAGRTLVAAGRHDHELASAAGVHLVDGRWMSALVARCDVAVGSATTTLALGSLLGGVPLLLTSGGGEQSVISARLSARGAARVISTRGGRDGELHRMSTDATARSRAASLGEQLRVIDSHAAVVDAARSLTGSAVGP